MPEDKIDRQIRIAQEVREIIEGTITELSSSCKITLYDIYGSANGWYIADFKINPEEDESEKSDGIPDNA